MENSKKLQADPLPVKQKMSKKDVSTKTKADSAKSSNVIIGAGEKKDLKDEELQSSQAMVQPKAEEKEHDSNREGNDSLAMEIVAKEWIVKKTMRKMQNQPIGDTKLLRGTNPLANNYYFCLKPKTVEVSREFRNKTAINKLATSNVAKTKKSRKSLIIRKTYVRKPKAFRRRRQNNRKARRNFFKKVMKLGKEESYTTECDRENTIQVYIFKLI